MIVMRSTPILLTLPIVVVLGLQCVLSVHHHETPHHERGQGHLPESNYHGKHHESHLANEHSHGEERTHGIKPETKPKFFNFMIPNRARSQPEKVIAFNIDRYGNWSTWTECIPKDCIEIRHRKCLDDSWKQPIPNRIRTSKCLSKFYVEKRVCTNTTACNIGVGSEMIENLSETCGIRPESTMPKIIGGEEAVPHSWPWAIRLAVKPPRRKSVSFCGGTLIAPQWIMTAAHCLLVENKRMPVGRLINIADHMKSSLYVHLGDHHRATREGSQVDIRITKAILRPNYHRKLMTDGFDIALLYLSEPVNITSEVGFSCLPAKDLKLEPGTKCYAVGWGNSEPPRVPTFDDFDTMLNPFPDPFGFMFTFDMPMKPFRRQTNRPHWKSSKKDLTTVAMHEVDLTIVGIDTCNKFYSELNDELHICAGSKGKDTCSGDSGGGLYCQLPQSDRWFVTGVTSFGLAKGCGRHPGVYTSVTAHMDWISMTMKRNIV